jgi:hypothetical protein
VCSVVLLSDHAAESRQNKYFVSLNNTYSIIMIVNLTDMNKISPLQLSSIFNMCILTSLCVTYCYSAHYNIIKV